MSTSPVRGIWYEKSRDRWRVKLYRSGELIERSYHKTYELAFEAWKNAKASDKDVIAHEREVINRFLYGS